MCFQNKDAIVECADGSLPLAREEGLSSPELDSEMTNNMVIQNSCLLLFSQAEASALPTVTTVGTPQVH